MTVLKIIQGGLIYKVVTVVTGDDATRELALEKRYRISGNRQNKVVTLVTFW